MRSDKGKDDAWDFVSGHRKAAVEPHGSDGDNGAVGLFFKPTQGRSTMEICSANTTTATACRRSSPKDNDHGVAASDTPTSSTASPQLPCIKLFTAAWRLK